MKHFEEPFRKQGYGEWKVKVAGRQVVGKVYPQDLEEFASWDNSYIEDAFPKAVDVLTVHGLADETVTPSVTHSSNRSTTLPRCLGMTH